MEAFEAIDEELESLAEERDLDAIVARAHEELPERSEGFEAIDALLENLGEAVAIPTVEPVGIDIPRPVMPPPRAVEPPAAEAEAGADTDLHPSVPPAEAAEAEPESVVEVARQADAAVDDVVSDTPSESGLDADALFGDLEGGAEGDLASLFDEDEDEALAAEPAAVEAPRPKTKPPTKPPPPPVEALGDVEEVDLDDIVIDDDDFELMIEDEGDTFVGDADAVEAALETPEGAEGEGAEGEAPAAAEGAGEKSEEDDPREHSFFKKLFG